MAGAFAGLMMQANVAAAQEVYLCKPKDPAAAGNWIAPEIAVAYKSGDATALVDDGIIQTFEKGPKEATVDVDNAKRMTFTWKVKVKSGTSRTGTQTVTMSYRLTIQKADKKASFIVAPQGYANTFQTQGKCEKIKG